MSQKVSRKSAVNDDKEKRNTDSPVKDMKKKMAANAEKEKQAAEKADKIEKSAEKVAEKAAEKADKHEKADKKEDKKSEKKETEKKSDKSEPQAEKSKGENSKEDKSAKSEKEKPEPKKAEPPKPKQNGSGVHNGVSDVTLGNGTDDAQNGTVSAESEDDDVMLVIDDHDHDELFPELTYDDTSDVECFEPPTPENVPSRSFTRRSQVKATRTPETPRPASDKQTDKETDEPKEKILKLKEDAPATDRKLRSADSPKPQDKKKDEQKKDGEEKDESKDVVGDKSAEKGQEEKNDVEIVVEVEGNEGEEAQRKTDTNFSKSRVKVSPYRRSMRLADQTNSSLLANYTGNNTTMEMDITESSSFMEEGNLDDSSYLRGLRSIRGRSSYKPLKEITLRHLANKSTRSNASANVSSSGSEHARPTGTVVGRKRKAHDDEFVELTAAALSEWGEPDREIESKRARMFERFAARFTQPFQSVANLTLPSLHRRNAEIVGINTDMPLTSPVVSPDTFDPESLKPVTPEPVAVPLPARDQHDNKRCAIM